MHHRNVLLWYVQRVSYLYFPLTLSHTHTYIQVRGDIASRSFGVFTNANKVLLRKALGNVIFEKLLHSSEASPLGGEGVTGIHNRCQKFYNHTIVPHLLAGENVLVITHLGFLNVMAHVLSKRDVNEYVEVDVGEHLSLSLSLSHTHIHTYTSTDTKIFTFRTEKFSQVRIFAISWKMLHRVTIELLSGSLTFYLHIQTRYD
mgnify:CR=1 FL=1